MVPVDDQAMYNYLIEMWESLQRYRRSLLADQPRRKADGSQTLWGTYSSLTTESNSDDVLDESEGSSKISSVEPTWNGLPIAKTEQKRKGVQIRSEQESYNPTERNGDFSL